MFVNETMACNGTHQGLEIELNKSAIALIKHTTVFMRI